MKRKNAFTLIELLVVIAVIAILMAILMPALQRTKKQAKTAACQTHLHQWSLIFSMYCDDNNSRFFNGTGEDGEPGTWGRFWSNPLKNYYQNMKIRFCPTATKTMAAGAQQPYAAWSGEEFVTDVDYEEISGSYGINGWLCNPVGDTVHGRGPVSRFWKTCDTKGSSEIPVFADMFVSDAFPALPSDPPEDKADFAWRGYTNEMNRLCVDRHNGAINVLFLDWSIRRTKLKQLWKMKWHRGYNVNAEPPAWPEWMQHLPD